MKDYLICHTSILPPYFEKVVQIKELLKKDKTLNIKEACIKIGLSRSTFYKYKDYIFVYEEKSKEALLSLLLSHKEGTLSSVLTLLSKNRCNINTISQSAPVDKTAKVDISIDISSIKNTITDLVNEMSKLEGVISVKLEKIKD